MIKNSILFITKQRKIYSSEAINRISSGLFNSANFVNKMLIKNGIKSNIVDVIDNNDIDREVTKHNPTHVIIEALWVIPEKFKVLIKRHPRVKWIIRLHSDIPFLANEGIAMEWIFDYMKYENIILSVNSKKILNELSDLIIRLPRKEILYLPNYYPVQFKTNWKKFKNKEINIGCFGAIRPMKNQLLQAISAMNFGDKIGRKIKFHINSSRVEGKGEPILKNIRNLFKFIKYDGKNFHRLVEHDWLTHEDFSNLISKMDINMQCSFSETYNIVSADAVNQNVPIVISSEVEWASELFYADPTLSSDIIKKLKRVWFWRHCNIHFINKILLWIDSLKSEKIWLKYFN